MAAPNNGRKTSPKAIEAKEKAARALQLRKQGKTFAEIAAAVGYNSASAAHDAVRRSIDAITREPAEELRALELERLDALWRSQYRRALAGRVGALNTCLRIMDRRIRLLGLDAPTRQEASKTLGGGVLVVRLGGATQ